MKTSKICTCCKVNLSLDDFHKSKSNSDGLNYHCKACKKLKSKKRKEVIILETEKLTKTKKCSKCKLIKSYSNFSLDKQKSLGISSQCKECRISSKSKILSSDNIATSRACFTCKKEKDSKYFFRDRTSKLGLKPNCKTCSLEKSRINFKDPIKNLKRTLRRRTSTAFKHKKYLKSSKTGSMLGCEWEELKTYIEKQFAEGMTWDNHGKGEGKWNLDHKVPLNSAKNNVVLMDLCHYTNLQPLWAKDNLSKGAKLDWIPS